MQDHRVQLVYGSYDERSAAFIACTVAQAYELRGLPWSIPADATPFRTPLGFSGYAASPNEVLKAGDTLEWIRRTKPEPTLNARVKINGTYFDDTSIVYVGMTIGSLRTHLYQRTHAYNHNMKAWKGIEELRDSDSVRNGDFIEFTNP